MFSKNINFKAFNYKPVNKKLKKHFSEILSKNNEILKSLTPNYKYNYSKNLIKKFKKDKVFLIEVQPDTKQIKNIIMIRFLLNFMFFYKKIIHLK